MPFIEITSLYAHCLFSGFNQCLTAVTTENTHILVEDGYSDIKTVQLTNVILVENVLANIFGIIMLPLILVSAIAVAFTLSRPGTHL